ncbi:MAG: hypothetical protein ACI86M_002609 [Saprospiraceae bacterium]|jgi:hypothetical protein
MDSRGKLLRKFSVYKNLDIYGGFVGSEILFSQRDVLNNKTEIFYNGAEEAIFLFDYNIKIYSIYFDGTMDRAIETSNDICTANML